ncbi:helix-turn-helix domain-containing protein [Epibacterium sp. SM1979]|uniref:Helix-turn-helix domain-containing protein n=1 Tax=Tritonibacter litoralis TaxID=2662264 RepID=A0A843YN40_9RHOB|nr:IclR family transcriptional regulator [Tritonibacter litoralis]MQQ10047.1 helix-turn-helix domain-containing protein [Tritonibacter litoralis]
MAAAERGADGTVGKALNILDQIAEFERPVRFGELLANSEHPKATLYRLVQSLTNQGMLSYDEERQTYAPGLRLVRLAHAAWRQSSLAPVARPFIDALASEVQETIHLAQLDRGQVLYVDKRMATNPLEMFSQAGKIGPGFCTGVGKAMMAFLEDEAREDAIRRQAFLQHTPNTLITADALRAELQTIRREGIAFDREEHEPGIICIASPILSESGRVIGALSITTSTQRQSLDGLLPHRPLLLKTASEIATAAETWQFPS